MMGIMRNFLVIFSVFAFLAMVTAEFSHAETVTDPQSIELTTHIDAADKDGQNSCDKASGCHAHCHNHFASSSVTDMVLPFAVTTKRMAVQHSSDIAELTYGLKRPPKI